MAEVCRTIPLWMDMQTKVLIEPCSMRAVVEERI
jgi:hypothetical protein